MSKVKVLARIKQGHKYPYLTVEWTGNRKIRPVHGATYHLRFTEGGERKMVSVGNDPAKAVFEAEKKQNELEGQRLGLTRPVESKLARIKMADAISQYLAETKEHKAHRTWANYKRALELFTEGCKVTYVDEIGRTCMLNFTSALRKREYAPRSVANYFSFVYTFLKRHDKAGVVGKNDWPKYEEVESEIYSEEDVTKLLDSCVSPRERLLILFAANTGFRHAEISHAQMKDVDFVGKTIETRSKPDLRFTTKDHEQRIIPVADSLLNELKKSNRTGLLFPARSGKPDKHLDRLVVRLCKRAKVVVPTKPMHAFRALYATQLNRAGVDPYTIQRQLGHSDLETTVGYLRAVKRSDPKLREQVNRAAF